MISGHADALPHRQSRPSSASPPPAHPDHGGRRLTMDAAQVSDSLSISIPGLRDLLGGLPPPTIVDVRRNEAAAKDPQRLPQAIKRDPAAVDTWVDELEPWRPVVVYCVHGHEVGQNAAAALAGRGLDARYLEGGLEGWR